LAKQYQQQAFRIEVAGDEGGHADIEYRAIRIAAGDVEHAVVNVLRFYESPSALVFCNTRDAVRHLQATLLERGFSVVALSGELTQNERTQALQSLRDGRARVCVATDVAARGIDLPNLDLVIHADLPNDAEVMQHRSGRTGRAGRKGVSVLLVVPARRRRAELLLNLAGIDVVWVTAPTADEIRKLDQERMLKDTLFAEETTADDLVLARAMLAERSPEDIAAALARLYRARLPSPEDILDPGQGTNRGTGKGTAQGTFRSRDDRGEREVRPARGEDRASGPRPKPGKSSQRQDMVDGSVWFRAAIGRRKNAEARWLLPMICRRGGIEKQDIGAIRIMDTTTEFEISARAADSFAAMIKRPDKEDNIRIEAMTDAPQRQAATETSARPPRREGKVAVDDSGRRERPRDGAERKPYAKFEGKSQSKFESKPQHKPQDQFQAKPYAKPHGESRAPFERDAGYEKKERRPHAADAGKPHRSAAPPARAPFAKKPKKKKQRD
jgi:ATP-dependent RNA helicase DeaD